MSNYITPGNLSPATVPAGVIAAQTTRATEAAKPQLIKASKTALVVKADPRKTRLAVEETWKINSRKMERNSCYLSCSLADKFVLSVKNNQRNVICTTRPKLCLKASFDLRLSFWQDPLTSCTPTTGG